MLQLAFGVLIMAVVAAVLGFGGVVGAAAGAAVVLFGVFVVLFCVSLVVDRRAR